MPYNPNIHHRRNIRLKEYDYSQNGLYFVTICCKDKICRFGQIEDGEMILNEHGKIAFDEWLKLMKRFSNFESDVFQIMPNHIHGIIILNEPHVGATLAVAQNTVNKNDNKRTTARVVPTIGAISDIIGAYKSLVMTECLKIYKSQNEIMGKFWQRNYYEHIIRNEKSFENIAKYIIDNPKMWTKDKLYIE